MLSEAQFGRIKPSVSEQQLRQRWRTRLLWALRALVLVCLLLVLKSVLIWPMRDLDAALGSCVDAQVSEARLCMRREIEIRRAPIERARMEVLALIALTLVTFGMALRVRFGLRQQLREHLLFSEQVFDAVPLPLALRTPDGVFLRVNAAFEQRFGLKHRDMLGRHMGEFFPADGVRKLQQLDARALSSAEPIEEEGEVPGRDGPERVIFRVQAVRAEGGAVLGLVLARQDVTELRAHEAELTFTNEKLRRLSAQMIDAQEDERRRIARDLHDQVGQILTAIQLQLGSVAKRGAVDDAASALMLAREFADEALRHTRDLSASLHPHLLDDLGLQPAANWLIDRFIRPLVPNVELRCRLEPARAPEGVELVAFRVVQEALTNAARHAHATRIGVILEAAGGTLSIEVIDDGVGFEGGEEGIEAKRGTSLGLASMSDRVAELGGELTLESTQGAGTSVRVQLPWAAERGQA